MLSESFLREFYVAYLQEKNFEQKKHFIFAAYLVSGVLIKNSSDLSAHNSQAVLFSHTHIHSALFLKATSKIVLHNLPCTTGLCEQNSSLIPWYTIQNESVLSKSASC